MSPCLPLFHREGSRRPKLGLALALPNSHASCHALVPCKPLCRLNTLYRLHDLLICSLYLANTFDEKRSTSSEPDDVSHLLKARLSHALNHNESNEANIFIESPFAL